MATGNPRLERWSNGGGSTLNGSITSGDTSLTITSGTSFPSSGDFRVVIDSEIVLVTAVSGTTWTIVRGQEGTTAAAHSNGAGVDLFLTTGSLDRAYQDGFTLPDYPYNRILDQGVTATASSFTWYNQGSTTCADADDGGLIMTVPTEATPTVRGKYLTAPATPWKATAYVQFGHGFKNWDATDGSYIGIFGRESSTDKLYYLLLRSDRHALWRMTNSTTFSAEVDTYLANLESDCWFQLEDDGTNVRGHISKNGYDWEEAWNEGRTSFMSGGINQIGFAVMSPNTGNVANPWKAYFKTWILE